MTTRNAIAKRPMVSVPRRGTAWDDHFVTIEVANGSTVSENVVNNITDQEKRGYTLIRQIIRLDVMPDVPGGVSGKQKVTLAMGVTSDDAFAALALPDPEVGVDFPVLGWLWRTQYIVLDELLQNVLYSVVRIDTDLHAARKLDRSTVFISVHSTVEQGTAFQIACTGLVRNLYKLP